MSALRKEREIAKGGTTPPPEAFDYEDDVTAEAIQSLADRARPILEQDEYVVIDGYVGSK
ncbi:MAG: hypothetical protein Q8M24_21540 [Pseudolabrys sp.]|nr:hypothetical protein [Pseudolabrys sp.]MDP2298033.1 hypothetical protein [Pseudolabrys sp.]